MLRRLAICFAFATCCFLNTWVELAQGEMPYFARFHPAVVTIPAVVAWEAIIIAILLLCWEVYSRSKRFPASAANLLLLVASIVPAGIASIAVLRASPVNLGKMVSLPIFWPLALMASIPLVTFCVLRPQGAGRILRRCYFYSVPVLCVVILQAGNATLFRHSRQDFADGPSAERLPASPSTRRVVWIIFDELSEAAVFTHRPAKLHLPNFDKLRAESFHALAASAPANKTEVSMPSLILGERFENSDPRNPRSLQLLSTSRPAPLEFRNARGVFDDARALGFNTALAGWALPYGRLLNASLTSCTWTADWLLSGVEEPSSPQPLLSSMKERIRYQLASFPLIGHIPGVNPSAAHRAEKRARFELLMKQAMAYASDPTLGLVLLHLPVPHPPGIYDRTTGRFTDARSSNYLDSLALADKTLGQIMQALPKDTALIVSADHGWRTAFWNHGPDWTAEEQAKFAAIDTSAIPFLVRLPGQHTELPGPLPFNTVVTRQMILAILRQELSTPGQIPLWIDSATHNPVPLPDSSTAKL